MAKLPLISCLLLSLCSLSLSANVFISIDCGSSASYRDENGISWTGDDEYVRTGESRSVQPSSSYSRVADTLRVFRNQTKHCYEIGGVKQGRVLVRATFFYGNYDGRNSPPVFDLLFDGYYWGWVNNTGPTPSRHEVVYTTTKPSISVCVSQDYEGQFPYINAIEVRSLEPSMYGALGVYRDSYSLFTRKRVAFGTNATIRFPEDPYDRLWRPDPFMNGSVQVTSDARLSGGIVLADRPPRAVLKNAVTGPTLNSTIDFNLALSTSINSSVYINWYFSEVTRLGPNQTRSFAFYLDNVNISKPFSPPYDNCTEMLINNISISGNTTISLVAAANSTLPPLVNAMEVFILGRFPLNNGTDEKDVEGLASLQKAFISLRNWSGDPCLPKYYNWDWIKCYGDRVQTLLLGGFGLSGLLPDFTSMDALTTINLSNNSLRGNIPDFLGSLPNLQILNLENNQFNGTIPASLLAKKGLILRVSGNPELCTSNSSCPTPTTTTSLPKKNSSVGKRKNILEIIFATIISSIIVLLS
ncbi:probable LRR receptor-like serine/threonine-protein kinase At1g05700 [Salvia miltiorrhiza]|uniref:probable LRR receptor-like serine/threonine-protein kinase At1g05700 n=1 Tax=Salvia miltiorrhiza TaxID=226208 RepID=UPI0025AB6116|nr:probable LRR receptor-like serine/threonine-protein kinase At1g05700 [Salvia miltiorrhiza]